MRIVLFAAPALLLAGGAAAQGRADALEPQAKVPPVAFRSALEGYRAFADQDLTDWRRANEEVAAAGGQAGQRPGQGPGQRTSKPLTDKPEASPGHGRHK